MRTTKAVSWAAVLGLPGLRRLLPSYFSEISLRCHRSNVSGVTMVATSLNTRLPNIFSHRQPASLVVVKSQSTAANLCAQDSVFFAQIFDHLLLLLVHPPGNSDEQHPERIQSSWHLRRLSFPNLEQASIFRRIKFLDTTGSDAQSSDCMSKGGCHFFLSPPQT